MSIPPVKIGMVHPGGMGVTIGKVLQANGHEVFCATEGRSDETKERGQIFEDVGTIQQLVDQVDVIFCIIGGTGVFAVYAYKTEQETVEFPMAQEIMEAGFKGVYVDCNTIIDDPEEARWEVALSEYVTSSGASYVSGAHYGYPDRDGRVLFVSGDRAEDIVELLPPGGGKLVAELISSDAKDHLNSYRDAKDHKRQVMIDNQPPNPEDYSRTDDSWIGENG